MHRSAEIQGLRALAVTLVLLFHANWLPGGYVGVDVFYVISGFLITGMIIRSTPFVFKEFYTRRAKRLLPASFLVLFVTAIIFWIFAPALSRVQFSKDLLASTWYVSNYLYAHWQNDYQNLGATPSPLIHYWSLAVEEQFYLFWPLLLMIFRKNLRIAISAITIISFLFSVILINTSPIFAFYSLPTRAFELGIGALIAIFNFRARFTWVGLSLIATSALIFDSNTAFPGFPALPPVMGAGLIVASIKGNLLLRNNLLQRIGDWSYSIYLWHWPLLTIPALVLQRNLKAPEKLLALIICIVLSALSYKYVENPIRKSKYSPKEITRFALIAGSALSLIAGVIYLSAPKASALDLARIQPVIYQDGCQMDKAATKPDLKCVYGGSGKGKLVLFGDSHAAQWFPAINKWALINRYQLIVMTKSSCPALPLPLKDNGAFKARACNTFRANAIAEINRIKPDLVIISNFEHYEKIAAKSFAGKLRIDSKILLIRDTPWPNKDIPTCLSTNRICDTQVPKKIQYSYSNIFDPVPILCTLKCPAKVDGLIAYRDQTHISVAMAEHLTDVLGAEIEKLVAK